MTVRASGKKIHMYEMYESKMMYGAELWVLDEVWKETDKIHGRSCKKILRLPRCAANGVAEMELRTDSRRGKAVWLTVKYWQRIMHMGIEDPVRQCYEWKKGNMRFESWAKAIKQELESVGLAYIWHSQQKRDTNQIKREL
jgi:hypothetical protein